MNHRIAVFVAAVIVAAGCGADTNNADDDSSASLTDTGAWDAGTDASSSGTNNGSDAANTASDAGGLDGSVDDDMSNDPVDMAGTIDVAADDGGDGGANTADMGVDMAPPSNDPFDPGSCSGVAWDEVDALARLGGNDAEMLDDATVMERTRTCDATGCGPWAAPEPLVLSFLTWSGGVTTRYTQLQIDTTLVLWNDEGSARLSVRHDTHVDRYPDDHGEGITFGFPAEVIPYPYIRAWNVAPENQYDYRDLENYLGRDAQLFVSPGCSQFLSVLTNNNGDITTEYAALYRY